MSKTLIVITRHNNEYDSRFWGFENAVPYTHKELGQGRKAIFIKKDEDRRPETYSKTITDQLRGDLPDEIGIIVHLNDEAAASIKKGLPDEADSKIKFCRSYSGQQKTFWDGTKEENSLPYNAFRAAIRNGAGQVEAFDRVWDFFLWDPVLEAKLELLQDILNDKTPEEKVLTVLRQGLPTFDNEIADFKKVSGDDLFTPQFQAAFKRLRDALDVD